MKTIKVLFPVMFAVLAAIGIVLFTGTAYSQAENDTKKTPCPVQQKSNMNSCPLAGSEIVSVGDDFEVDRWDPELSKKFASVIASKAKGKGCLSCHDGIMEINEKMQKAIDAIATAFGNPNQGYGCVICHEGKAEATTKEQAHEGLYPNPGSMWVISQGFGCAKCHSDSGALTTIMAKELGIKMGGTIKSVLSKSTDPKGQSNHVYRMQRALMSLEFGKASHTLMSNGVIEKGKYIFADFEMDDPDGAVPTTGTEAYKKWIEKAIEQGYIDRVEQTQQIPDFEQGMKLWNDPVKASFSDYYRKQCGRCHVWGEGRRKRGDLRGGGCAACHVLYTNDAMYEGDDPTIPKDRGGHMMKHQITTKIPATQCNHCHTRGKRIGTSYSGVIEFDYISDKQAPPFDRNADPQEKLYTKDYIKVHADIHLQKGLQCIDCHTSIDVHGDGNIYPTTLHQVEIQCADCHGTPKKYPWELPVGYGTPVVLEGERGTFDDNRKQYMLTSRGNPKAKLERRGDKAILTGLFDEKEHEVPLLKEKELNNTWKTDQGRVAMATVSQHLDKVECYACHSSWAPQCYGCHTVYDRREVGTDWIATAMNHDRKTGKQIITKTKGEISVENRGYLRWEDPILGINIKGKVTPVIPGCQTFWTYIDENGKILTLNKTFKTSTGDNSPTMAPVQPHTTSMPARTCESCHTNPKTIGYGMSNSRSIEKINKENPDKPLFTDLSDGYYGDIPGSTTAKWQVPKIEDFPYSLDQLVTRTGKQTQNMPHLEDRPLNEEERNKMEREGLCASCHQHYNTELWENVRKKLGKALVDENGKSLTEEGKALTPELHDKAVEVLLKAFSENESQKKKITDE